ncbi:glutamate--cysteine ligase [Candidatus Endowatersipora endosymbiont of Watersipora subatra]|uniref:glutamate--cysteine ligase n=1 Tax=Candidatus Endowatersipora endosymbiont of Watersipora subatra TaxID=3077946 RepID=UPI00312CA6D3
MAKDIINTKPLEDKEQLVQELSSGCKQKKDWRIGTEHERFGFYKIDYSPVPYEGKNGIRALLNGMKLKKGWDPIIDAGNIIGLTANDGMGAISLEPGGQFELSGAPLRNIHETSQESNHHINDVREISESLGIGFLGLGGSPKWTFEDTPKMPKSRYDIMRAYMPKVGNQGLDMMHRTCTIQVNLDFSSEEDMCRKMQVSTKLQSIAAALFSNSPFSNGKLNGLLSWRSDIWRDTDNQRAGLHEFMIDGSLTFERYVEWALDVPMYFVMRDGIYYDCTHITFRQFMGGSLKGEIPDGVANEGDWVNHLSTLFPDVRLKKFLEMRGADGAPWRLLCAVPALWVGLLYDEGALADAQTLTDELSIEDVIHIRELVPRFGLKVPVGRRTVFELAKDMVNISHKGLSERGCFNHEKVDENQFLFPLDEVIELGQTPAENLIKEFKSKWNGNINKIFEEYSD